MAVDWVRGSAWLPPQPFCSHPRASPALPPAFQPAQDVYKTAEQVKAAGGKVTREPGPVPGLGTKILACTDPDG